MKQNIPTIIWNLYLKTRGKKTADVSVLINLSNLRNMTYKLRDGWRNLVTIYGNHYKTFLKNFSFASFKLTRPLFCFVLFLERKNKTTDLKRFKLFIMTFVAKKTIKMMIKWWSGEISKAFISWAQFAITYRKEPCRCWFFVPVTFIWLRYNLRSLLATQITQF